MKNLYLLALLMPCLGIGQLAAQVLIYTPDTLVAPTELVTIEVRTQAFTDIATAQFSINWEADVLTFEGITSLNLPGLSADNLDATFGTTTAPDGQIGFLWSEDMFNNYSHPDDAPLFALVFRATGNDGDTTQLTITGEPTDIELADENGMVQTTQSVAGTVRIDSSVNTRRPVRSSLPSEVIGNPLYPGSQLRFQLPEAAEVYLDWLTPTGTHLHTQKIFIPAGRYDQPIVAPSSLPDGVYYLHLQTTDFTVAHRVLLVR